MDELKRRYELTLTMGADDLPSLRGMLNTLIYDLLHFEDDKLEPNPYNAVSGGYSGNHSMKLELRPDVTHDSYMELLHAHLEKQKENEVLGGFE